jgi:hypothetical protein
MIRSLLRVLNDVSVQRYGVKVILTTHSPTTVALAPEEAIYAMRRTPSPRLQRTTRDHAVSALTVGISTLSVKLENKRQLLILVVDQFRFRVVPPPPRNWVVAPLSGPPCLFNAWGGIQVGAWDRKEQDAVNGPTAPTEQTMGDRNER